MTRYYVKAAGSDAADGLADATAWATVSKANATAVAGDIVAFKAGDSWTLSTLNPANSGTAGSPITFTSYGAGAKPIISYIPDVPGWTVSGNWTNAGGNTWYLTVTFPWGPGKRIFLNGTMYFEATSAAAITSTLRFFSDTALGRFYVYATSNPATFYTSMRLPTLAVKNGPKLADGACFLTKDWINLQNIEFQGGWACIHPNGCNHCDLSNLTIGKWCIMGIDTGLAANTYLDVHHSLFDAGMNMDLAYFSEVGGDGIRTWEGSLLNANIYQNTFLNWAHTGCSISGTGFNAMRFIKVYDNDMSCPLTNYGRGFDCTGTSEDSVRDNQFFRNYVHDTSVPVQINGNHNYIYRNVINGVLRTGYNTSYSYGVVMHSATAKITHHNVFSHNVIYNTADSSIWLGAAVGSPDCYSNEIKNNIFMNWGSGGKGILGTNDAGLYDNIFQNNLLYKSGDTTSPVSWKGTVMSTATFNSTIIGASGNLTGDPLFASAGTGNFTLLQSAGIGSDEVIGYTAGATATGNVAGFCYGHSNATVTPAGSGARLLKELSGEVRAGTPTTPYIRLAIYRASDRALIAQGTAKVQVTGASHTWQGHLTQASMTPNPANLVGGTAYRIIVSHQGSVEHKNGTVTSGDSGIVFTDYGDAGFAATLPAQSATTSMPNIRAVLQGLPVSTVAIDAGVVIPGINDGYSGTAPDIGAYEYVADTDISIDWVSGDRIRETSTSTGLTEIILDGAVTLFRPFSAVCTNGDLIEYAIVHQTLSEMEVGMGRWLTGGVLQRLTVSESSNSTGNGLVNFSAGTKDVFCTFPAAHGVMSPVSRRQTSNQLLPPGASSHVVGRYEVGLGTRLEIGTTATMEIG